MNNNRPNQSTNRISEQKRQEILKRKRKQQKKQATLAKIFIFLLVFTLLSVITIICIGCRHNQNANESTSNGDITVDKGETKPQTDASLSSFLNNGVLYINFTELATKCDMTISGTTKEQTFSVTSGDTVEYMTVSVDSNVVIINGVTVHTQNNALLKDSDIWLSVDFVSNSVNGVNVKYDSETKTLTCKRTELNASTKDNPLYETVSFTHNVTKPLDTQVNTSETNTHESTTEADTTKKEEKPISKYNFKADLSAYEKYMDPENRDDYLVIANRNILLSADYVPKDLTKVYKAKGTADKYKMTFVAAKAFEAMVKESEQYGLDIYPCSGYRSYQTQKYLFQNYVNGHMKNDGMTYAQAFAEASTYSMVEGASEHQTGLTMDVNWTETTFGATNEAKWLVENCYKFGFIIRYPADKEDITGISWEPWHLRYVGRYHAEQMHKLNLCLEEDLVRINKMPS